METQQPDQTQERVQRALDRTLKKARSPEAADAIVERAEQLAAGTTEEDRAREAAGTPDPAKAIEQSARRGPEATLVETAAQAVARNPESAAVVRAAQQAGAQGGREELQQAVLRRMGRIERLDARLFLALNANPALHPKWLGTSAERLGMITTGGWIWSAGVAWAWALGVRRGRRTLVETLPVVLAVNVAVELPLKAFFRRRRPFIDVVRAVVVGKRPGNWSFPSGHTATSFAAAWALSKAWPARAPLFFAAAATVGASRVYIGAHYPGDVVSGAFFGITLGSFFRGLLRLATRSRP